MTRNSLARGAFRLGAIATAAILICGDAAESDGSPPLNMGSIVQECADFPSKDMDMEGVLIFLAPIVCNDAVTIHVNENLFVTAANLHTTNVHFVVHSGGRLTMGSSEAVIIERDDSSIKLLLEILGGRVNIDVGGWIADHAKSTTEDDGGVLNVKQRGSLDLNSGAKIMYTANSIIVSHRSPQNDKNDEDDFTSAGYEDMKMFTRDVCERMAPKHSSTIFSRISSFFAYAIACMHFVFTLISTVVFGFPR